MIAKKLLITLAFLPALFTTPAHAGWFSGLSSWCQSPSSQERKYALAGAGCVITGAGLGFLMAQWHYASQQKAAKHPQPRKKQPKKQAQLSVQEYKQLSLNKLLLLRKIQLQGLIKQEDITTAEEFAGKFNKYASAFELGALMHEERAQVYATENNIFDQWNPHHFKHACFRMDTATTRIGWAMERMSSANSFVMQNSQGRDRDAR